MVVEMTYEDARERVFAKMRARDIRRYNDPRTDDDYILVRDVEEQIVDMLMEHEERSRA